MLDMRQTPRRRGTEEIHAASPVQPTATLIGHSAQAAVAMLVRTATRAPAAERLAATLALDLAVAPEIADEALREILRDHLARLLVTWPAALGLAPPRLPRGWQDSPSGVARAVFGAADPPADGAGMEAFLAGSAGVGPVLAAIDALFPPGTGVAEGLAGVDPGRAFRVDACENSAATRQAARPALRHLEHTRGPGLLWRAAARLWDIADILDGAGPCPQAAGPGAALVPTSRGVLALRVQQARGRVITVSRCGPIDHLLAPGGVLERTLATLPAEARRHRPLVIDLLDPCRPVSLG